jgi:hypothetical protein
MRKAFEKLREILENNPKLANRLYKAVTFSAAAISITLILVMALSKPVTGIVPAPDSPDEKILLDDRKDALDGQYGNDVPDDGKESSEKTPDDAPGPSPSSRPPMTLTFTDKEAAGLIALTLGDRIPIKDISVLFSAPNIVTIGGKIDKSGIDDLIDEKNLPLLKAALFLAPDSLDISLAFSLALDGGHLSASPVKAMINDINITRFIPQSAVDHANEALHSLLPDEVHLLSLSIDDGTATFTIRA